MSKGQKITCWRGKNGGQYRLVRIEAGKQKGAGFFFIEGTAQDLVGEKKWDRLYEGDDLYEAAIYALFKALAEEELRMNLDE